MNFESYHLSTIANILLDSWTNWKDGDKRWHAWAAASDFLIKERICYLKDIGNEC